jgi:hypothetical protein
MRAANSKPTLLRNRILVGEKNVTLLSNKGTRLGTKFALDPHSQGRVAFLCKKKKKKKKNRKRKGSPRDQLGPTKPTMMDYGVLALSFPDIYILLANNPEPTPGSVREWHFLHSLRLMDGSLEQGEKTKGNLFS